MTKEEKIEMEKRYESESESSSSKKKTYWRIFIGVLTVAILVTIGVVAGYYISTDLNSKAPVSSTTPDTTSTRSLPTIRPTTTSTTTPSVGQYYVGAARTDVTGPIVQVNMMGYAHPDQIATGLYTRLYSRAFVIADEAKQSRVAFVSFDGGMTSQLLKLEVVKRLQARLGDVFDERNVVISGTHTHSGPAGFFQYLLFEITSLGHINQSTEAFVEGITQSIILANSNLKKSTIRLGSADVEVGNINRSPTSYLLNPEEERKRYMHDTEQELELIRFDSLEGEALGLISWYPVHPTSMNASNTLINSDNKGKASVLFEKHMRKEGETQTGKETFVAAFAQSNQGDVSPNTNGSICIDTGEQCENKSSTCGGSVENCVAFGPGKDMFESTDIIGTRQYEAGIKAFENADKHISGPVSYIHQYVDMSHATVELDDGSEVSTCKPGMGYSFAAGTTDGPGGLGFTQGMTKGTRFWDNIRDVLVQILGEEPPPTYYTCHDPKPVLLPTGYMDVTRKWHPDIVDIQILRIGQLIIAAVPGEYSTMAGRRLREKLTKEAIARGMPEDTKVVIAGLSNLYTHYITTPEEYEAQRYEAASTIYGKNTFHVYQQKFVNLIQTLIDEKQDGVDPGPKPELLEISQSPIAPLPAPDKVPEGVGFGDVVENVNNSYSKGDTVRVKFHGANPRHNMKLESTYFEIRQLVDEKYVTILNDADWSTKLTWEDENSTSPQANISLFSTMFDVIAQETGWRIDLDRALALQSENKLLDDSAINYYVQDDVITKRRSESLLDEMKRKGILHRESPAPNKDTSNVASYVIIEWEIPLDQESGTYQIIYYGDYLTHAGASPLPFQGKSSDFLVQ